MTKSESRVPGSACPGCGAILDAATNMIVEDGSKPSPGDLTICLYCALLLEFGEHLQLTKKNINYLTIDELILIDRAQDQVRKSPAFRGRLEPRSVKRQTIPDDRCPYCDHKTNASTNLTQPGVLPKVGDVGLCAHCAGVTQYDEELRLQRVDWSGMSRSFIQEILDAQKIIVGSLKKGKKDE